jgi:hypothetical protein
VLYHGGIGGVPRIGGLVIQTIKYKDFCYATMDKCDVNYPAGGCGVCQMAASGSARLAKPSGWTLVPYDPAPVGADIVRAVVSQADFSTHIAVFENGMGFLTKNGWKNGTPTENGLYGYGLIDTDTFLLNGVSTWGYLTQKVCNSKVLMRTPC